MSFELGFKQFKLGEGRAVMKTLLVATLVILLSANAYGQARKCTGPDGRVTYSDVVCDNKAVGETRVNTNANTIDHSGMRAHVQNQLAAREAIKADESLRMQRQAIKPQECKFSHYAYGDDKGKQLAINAVAECKRNNQARLNGDPVSNEHYNLWMDHRSIKVVERNGAIAAAGAAQAATNAAIQNSFNTSPKLTCRPGVSSKTLECN